LRTGFSEMALRVNTRRAPVTGAQFAHLPLVFIPARVKSSWSADDVYKSPEG
jgi:hypothetical protein